MGQAASCFARLVRVILGPGSIASSKVESGSLLRILGVDLELASKGFRCWPAQEKIQKWRLQIVAALVKGELQSGEAAKLAGRLSWASSYLFKRFGRALLRPIFDQCTRRDGKIDRELRRSLEWWKKVLGLSLAEVRDWVDNPQPVCHLFCDASGSPPHLGAVALVDGQAWWTHMPVPTSVLSSFKNRRDNQIMGLELLAISLGMCTFQWLLAGRSVVVHCDNTGSEVSRAHPLSNTGFANV